MSAVLLVFDYPDHNTLGLRPPQGHMHGGGSLSRRGVLTDPIGYSQLNEGGRVRIGRLGVGMESTRLGEVRGIKDPEAFGSDFTGVTVPQASPSDVKGEEEELGAGGRDG
jgi:hypothetical protein